MPSDGIKAENWKHLTEKDKKNTFQGKFVVKTHLFHFLKS